MRRMNRFTGVLIVIALSMMTSLTMDYIVDHRFIIVSKLEANAIIFSLVIFWVIILSCITNRISPR